MGKGVDCFRNCDHSASYWLQIKLYQSVDSFRCPCSHSSCSTFGFVSSYFSQVALSITAVVLPCITRCKFLLVGISYVFNLFQNFNIDVVSPECSLDLEYWGKVRVKLWLPIILTFGSSFLKAVVTYYDQVKGTLKTKFRRKDIFLKVVLTYDRIVLLLFTMILSTIASFFDCSKISENLYVLRAYPSSSCYSTEWFSRLGEISFFILLYVLIFPVRLCWIYFQMTIKPELRIHNEFHYLTSGYKPTFFWWDIVLLLKRTAFVMLSQFLFSSVDSSVRLLSSAIGILGFTALDLLCRPYQSHAVSKNNLNLMLLLILLCQGMIFENGDSEATNIFVAFVVVIFVITAAHSCVVMFHHKFSKFKSRSILLDSGSMKKLQLETRKQVLELWTSEKCDLHGEIEMEVDQVLKHKDANFEIGDLLACRRRCDIIHGQDIMISDKRIGNSAARAVHQGENLQIHMSVVQKNV
jgi:hypothetical protein